MKDQEFRNKAYEAGKAICQYLSYDKIVKQSPDAPKPEQLYSRIATLATDNYAKLKRHRDAILATTKKAKKGVAQFTAIRDRHGHLPFLLAAFSLVYEYSIPFGWIEGAFKSQMVKDVHMSLKTGKSSASRAGKRNATRRNGTGVTPKGSRENNIEISNINDLCVYAYARFRNENPSNPEKVVFDCVFRNYIKKAFENAAIEWRNDHCEIISRERVVAEVRAFVNTIAFKQYLPESHKDIDRRIECHEQVGARAWEFCKGKFQSELCAVESDECVSVAGDEMEECSIHYPFHQTPVKESAIEDAKGNSNSSQLPELFALDDLQIPHCSVVRSDLEPIAPSLELGDSPFDSLNLDYLQSTDGFFLGDASLDLPMPPMPA